jgi:HEAT repeat protein
MGIIGSVSARDYPGETARSRSETRSFACSCGERFGVRVQRAVDARADPLAAAALCAGRVNRAACPACGREWEVQASVVYCDARAERLVLVLPDGLRHRELEERALLYRRLADDGVPAPPWVRDFQVVFGADELRTLLGAADGAAPEATDVKTRPRPALPDARSAAVERWIANREGPSAVLCDGAVVMCAALAPPELEPLVDGELELRMQLHRLPTYPVIAITVLAAGRKAKPLHALLEIGRAAHRAVLEQLGRRCALHLELFDAAYAPAVTREATAPLEENLQRIFAAAKQALQNIAPAQRNFERARTSFLAPSYERLGRVQVALSPSDLGAVGALESPRAVRRAVAQVAHWSEPAAEGYLVEIRSFPLPLFRELRREVVQRALACGIHTPRPLAERAAKEGGLAASWPELLERQVAAFTRLVQERRSDLTAAEQADNWRLLVEECRVANLSLDPVARALADETTQPLQREAARATEALRGRETAELVALLERRELRRDAALAICERGDRAGLAAVFAALRRMTRAEASRVLPATVLGFGQHAAPLLVEGLRSRRSYLRQGSALALGALAAAAAADPMAELLVEEPTDVWREVARALGDLGEAAVAPLVALLPTARGEARDRIVRALAHLAARGGHALVERLAATGDVHAREAAPRALAMRDEIRQGDAEVRGGQAPRDQTVVRSFSRRFFETLGGYFELSDADLEELPDADGDSRERDEADESEPLPDEAALAAARARGDATDPRMDLPGERVP